MALCAVAAMASCSNNDFEPASTTPAPSSAEPQTQVSVSGQEISTLASAGNYVTKLAAGNSQETVYGVPAAGATGDQDIYFFVRVDNSEVGDGSAQSSTYYFPQTSDKGSLFATANKGTVDASANVSWKPLDDRTTKYVYDSKGEVTKSTLKTAAPSLGQLIKANEGKSIASKLTAIDTTKYKIIWYVVKHEDKLWHCDGILVTNETTEVPDSIKPDGMDDQGKKDDQEKPDTTVTTSSDSILVDIHQQEHKDWTQIKTSVHVRDTVSQIVVEIPIPVENVAEQDDFAIRTYTLETPTKVYINGAEYNLKEDKALSVKVEHQATKVVITIDILDKSYIEALKDATNGDGPTIEINTYGKNLTNEQLWQLVKQSKVTAYSYKETVYEHVHTDISNAFNFE